MEAQQPKRRRVYSLEPNKKVQSIFARNYLSYLVPALMKIKEKSSEKEDSQSDIKNVKYEVDMAMVSSTQGFAWSNGLKVKLQRDNHVNAAPSSSSIFENEDTSENEIVPLDFSNSNCGSKFESCILGSNKSMSKDMLEMEKDLGREDNIEDEDKLKRLRRLIPGGEEMCDEQVVTELESYISCLQMQQSHASLRPLPAGTKQVFHDEAERGARLLDFRTGRHFFTGKGIKHSPDSSHDH